MTYIKLDLETKEVIETGNIKKLIPRCSNPVLLTEEEQKAQGVYLAIPFEYSLESWQQFGDSTYSYDEDTDTVREIKEIVDINLDTFKVTKINEIKNTYSEILTSRS